MQLDTFHVRVFGIGWNFLLQGLRRDRVFITSRHSMFITIRVENHNGVFSRPSGRLEVEIQPRRDIKRRMDLELVSISGQPTDRELAVLKTFSRAQLRVL